MKSKISNNIFLNYVFYFFAGFVTVLTAILGLVTFGVFFGCFGGSYSFPPDMSATAICKPVQFCIHNIIAISFILAIIFSVLKVKNWRENGKS